MYPNTNLQPGMTGPEVKKLQDFLISKGLLSPQDAATGPGIYGPKTTAAVKLFQQQNGVNNSSGPGYWGPQTIKAASSAGASNSQPGATGGLTQERFQQIQSEVHNEINNNPFFQNYTNAGNTPQQIEYAMSTGDISSLVDEYGQPFDTATQQEALKQGMEADKAFYDAQKSKETADAEATLADKQASYQDYLLKSGQNFQQDKTTADENAANQGVLFSGSRVQKEQNLQRAYQQDQATKLRNLTSDIGSTARDYQYKYGNNAANGLSQYYQAGGNTYNPNVATGGVSTGGLSNIYNPGQYNYAGTRVGEQVAQANKRAAALLTNKANKLVSTGYTNQIN
jgi:peptidoglycan hydrolase-like protein with peptidoglycan-binding domain